jgi:hypothetical protein
MDFGGLCADNVLNLPAGDGDGQRNVIAVLVDNFGEDLIKLIKNIDLHFEDGFKTNLLLFHSGYPTGLFRVITPCNARPDW